MATRVASYDVIADDDISLNNPGDEVERSIDLDSTADVSIRSVLSFMVKAENDPNNLRFSISIKAGGVTKTLIDHAIGSNVWRTWQEVIGQNVLIKSATGNKLVIKYIAGAGTLVLSDIVLLYSKTF